MTIPPDDQQQKVYDAEYEFWRNRRCLEDSLAGSSLNVWKEYLNNKIFASKGFRKTFGITDAFRAIEVKPSYQTGVATGRSDVAINYSGNGGRVLIGGIICLPENGRRISTALHEAAHVVCPDGFASHGPEYCRCLLKIIRLFMGADDERELRKSFSEFNVQFEGGGFFSPERRWILRQRFKTLRASINLILKHLKGRITWTHS